MSKSKQRKSAPHELQSTHISESRKVNVAATMVTLNGMTMTELRERYAEVFGEATRSFHKTHLVHRIIWRMQALAEGGLSERAFQRAKELACEADLRVAAPLSAHRSPNDNDISPTTAVVLTEPFKISTDCRLPMPGAVIQRRYKGQTIRVKVLTKGFEFEGEAYRSLSAIARRITGAHWNGPLFFRLNKANKDGDS